MLRYKITYIENMRRLNGHSESEVPSKGSHFTQPAPPLGQDGSVLQGPKSEEELQIDLQAHVRQLEAELDRTKADLATVKAESDAALGENALLKEENRAL
ncbi:MAG: hypothetical protein LBQ12_06685, partial [Deltaproteobacteria bacterium]|nr:hypothetical protein [Deltaproteobacteria bacterium]